MLVCGEKQFRLDLSHPQGHPTGAGADGLARRGLAGGDDAVGGVGRYQPLHQPASADELRRTTGVGAHLRPQAQSISKRRAWELPALVMSAAPPRRWPTSSCSYCGRCGATWGIASCSRARTLMDYGTVQVPRCCHPPVSRPVESAVCIHRVVGPGTLNSIHALSISSLPKQTQPSKKAPRRPCTGFFRPSLPDPASADPATACSCR